MHCHAVFMRPAAMSRASCVPIVDGLLAPPADAADEHIRLWQLVSRQSTFGDAEPLRHLGQTEIPFHASRPVMMAVAASSPADSPASPAAIGLPLTPASRETTPATADRVHHVFDCLFMFASCSTVKAEAPDNWSIRNPCCHSRFLVFLVASADLNHRDEKRSSPHTRGTRYGKRGFSPITIASFNVSLYFAFASVSPSLLHFAIPSKKQDTTNKSTTIHMPPTQTPWPPTLPAPPPCPPPALPARH